MVGAGGVAMSLRTGQGLPLRRREESPSKLQDVVVVTGAMPTIGILLKGPE